MFSAFKIKEISQSGTAQSLRAPKLLVNLTQKQVQMIDEYFKDLHMVLKMIPYY